MRGQVKIENHIFSYVIAPNGTIFDAHKRNKKQIRSSPLFIPFRDTNESNKKRLNRRKHEHNLEPYS